MNFTIEHGIFFIVLVFDDYVIKIPRKFGDKGNDKKVREIVEFQNLLASHFPEVQPVKDCGGYLKVARAKGVRCDRIANKKISEKCDRRRKELGKRINSLGYRLKDLTKRNTFYDKNEDRLYVVDFHLFDEKVEQVKNKRPKLKR